jgi:hypothetical protein
VDGGEGGVLLQLGEDEGKVRHPRMACSAVVAPLIPAWTTVLQWPERTGRGIFG